MTLLDQKAYRRLGKPQLAPTSVKIFTYNSKEPLPLKGALQVQISHNGHTVAGTAFICPGDGGNLLSGKMASKLGLIHMTNAVSIRKNTSNILNEKTKFPRPVSGISKLKDFSVKIPIDRSVQQVANTNRRIPLHLRVPVKKQLQQHQQQQYNQRPKQLVQQQKQQKQMQQQHLQQQQQRQQKQQKHFYQQITTTSNPLMTSYHPIQHQLTEQGSYNQTSMAQHVPVQIAATRPPGAITQLRPQAITLPSQKIRVHSSPALPNSVRLPPPIPQRQAFVAILPLPNHPPPARQEGDDIPEHPPAPERRGLRPKRRPDPLSYEGKGVQRKKQDDNNSHV